MAGVFRSTTHRDQLFHLVCGRNVQVHYKVCLPADIYRHFHHGRWLCDEACAFSSVQWIYAAHRSLLLELLHHNKGCVFPHYRDLTEDSSAVCHVLSVGAMCADFLENRWACPKNCGGRGNQTRVTIYIMKAWRRDNDPQYQPTWNLLVHKSDIHVSIKINLAKYGVHKYCQSMYCFQLSLYFHRDLQRNVMDCVIYIYIYM